MSATEPQLWLPSGVVDSRQRAVEKAISEYDERLILGKLDDQWAVMIKQERPLEPITVLGLGFELPHPEWVVERIARLDTLRSNSNLLDKIRRANEAREREARKRADEQVARAAEELEFHTRKAGLRPENTFVIGEKRGKH